MRKIEFRGKTIAEPSEWVYGGITSPNEYSPNWLIWVNGFATAVHEESIGQLIEFSFWNEEDTEVDKSREYVYEGDIILAGTRWEREEWDRDGEPDFLKPYRIGFSSNGTEVILYDKDGEAVEQWDDGDIEVYGIDWAYTDYSEILGNYFDNPELMEDK